MLDKFSEERIIEIGMGIVPVSRGSFGFGGLLARNELVGIDSIFSLVTLYSRMGEGLFVWFEISITGETLSQLNCNCWLSKVDEKIVALGWKVMYFISPSSDGADWALAGQRLCLPASAHSFLALKCVQTVSELS